MADHEADYETHASAPPPPATTPELSEAEKRANIFRNRLCVQRPHPDDFHDWRRWMVAAIFVNAEAEHTDLDPKTVSDALDAIWAVWNDAQKAEDMNWAPVFEPWSDAQARRFNGEKNPDVREALANAFYGMPLAEDGWANHPANPIDMGPVADAAMRGGAA